MRPLTLRTGLAIGAAALLLSACGGSSSSTSSSGSAGAAPSGAASSSASGFDATLAKAKGQTVNWYMYGGDDKLNSYVNGYVKQQLSQQGITLNQVKITDTAEAVNKVLGEKQAGKTDDGGSVDLIWINGENFATLKQADAVYCGYVKDLPSTKDVDLSTPGIANDFGLPTDGCEVPWQQATSALVYNSEHLTADDTKSVDSLFAWSKAHPGRFTYPAPPDFTGSMAVRTFFYDTAGGPKDFLGAFDSAKFDKVAPQLWQRLNDLEPSLWRGGKTYPASGSDVEKLFANGEIDAYLTYGEAAIGSKVDKGTLPKTTKSAVFDKGNIGNYSFTAIPKNASHKGAAEVLANLLLSPEAALVNAGPDGAGFTSAIDLSKLPTDQRDQFVKLTTSPYQVAPEKLADATLPEVVAGYVTALEKGWKENVLQK